MRIRLPKATAGDPPELLDAHPLALQALAAALQPPLLVQLATGAQLAASRMLCFRGKPRLRHGLAASLCVGHAVAPKKSQFSSTDRFSARWSPCIALYASREFSRPLAVSGSPKA